MTNAARLTALFSVSRLHATKRIRRDSKTGKIITSPYGRETHFQVKYADLGGLDHLCRVLNKLTKMPSAFAIRGEPLPGIDLRNTRRLLRPEADTGEPATRNWFAVDCDKVKRPVAIDPVTDPDAAIEYLIGLLPPELHDASCWWQFTCSQSLPGCEDTLSARLWFWSLDPLDDASLARWAVASNKSAGARLIDPSLYRAVQPHYIASPIFEDMSDPLSRRHGIRGGLDRTVSLVIPQPAADDEYVDGAGYVGLGVEGHLAEIGGERGFRAPMVSAIAAYFTANGADANPEPIKARVREAIARADPGGRSAADIGRYCSDRHLNDIVGWIRARERVNPRPAAQQTPCEFLQSLATSVPIGGERPRAVRAIAEHLFRQRFLNAPLARSLVEAWNATHCTPPLPPEQIEMIVNAIAALRSAAEGARHA
jgi:hypothetical protein